MSKKLPFKTVRRAHLYEEVAEQIKTAIFDGLLEPGDSLPSERELAEMFGVGRPTIREALRILKVMGLVEINPGIRGSKVKKVDLTQYLDTMRQHLAHLIEVDKESIRNIWEVRRYVELGIARCAAQNATPQELQELEDLLHKMESCGDDIHAYFPLAVEFHQKLALASGNGVFYIIWNMFHDILLRGYMPILDDLFPNGPEGLLRANKVLLEAIKSRDTEAIEHAMEIHAEEERLFPLDKLHGNRLEKGLNDT